MTSPGTDPDTTIIDVASDSSGDAAAFPSTTAVVPAVDDALIRLIASSPVLRDALTRQLESRGALDAVASEQDFLALLDRIILELDELVIHQLNVVIHHPAFQALESAWLALERLVHSTEADHPDVKIRVFNATWQELRRDQERAPDFDRSVFFTRVYTEQFSTLGGEPFGLIISTFELMPHVRPGPRANGRADTRTTPTEDIETLRRLASIGAAAFVPVLFGVAPGFLGLDDFSELAPTMNIQQMFPTGHGDPWQRLRGATDARFLGFTLPRVLARARYTRQREIVGGLPFEEIIDPANGHRLPWVNATFAFAAVAMREFVDTGWFSHIRGAPRGQYGGGIVLASERHIEHFGIDRSIHGWRWPVEVAISESMDKPLSENGLIPLSVCYDTQLCAFFSNSSVHRPGEGGDTVGDMNARISSMLQYLMCASRFAHYIKMMMREKVGSYNSPEECEDFLHAWLREYTNSRDDIDDAQRAAYPLRDAAVAVSDTRDSLGVYTCVITLQPHYQSDNLVSELRLVTQLHALGSA